MADHPAESRSILGMRVDAVSYARAAGLVAARAEAGLGGYVCVANVHMVMEGQDDPAFLRLVNDAFLVTPDGMPLVWGLRRLGVERATRVYGPTLVPHVCAVAARRGVPVGFYGGTPGSVEGMVRALRRSWPDLRVAWTETPPFRPPTPEEDEKTVRAIEESGARIVFVGLGCPKQERWMAEHAERLGAVLLGVGAAFDFLAGAKPQAPAWMQSAGLEWLFRLASEPRRLWRRYLEHNPRFALRFARQLLRER